MYDDGRKQGRKRTAARASEFQKVNNFPVNLGHVTHHPPSKLISLQNLCIFSIENSHIL